VSNPVRMSKLSRPRALIGFAAFACLVGAVLVPMFYGGEIYATELAAGFLAALLAFVLALEFEGDRERRRLRGGARRLRKEREDEVRRRFESVRQELKGNRKSIEFLKQEFAKRPPADAMHALHPQLLDSAWSASASRLTELVADFKLTADLAVAYGRIEELRWRLRFRTAHRDTTLDEPTAALVGELLREVDGLILRVDDQVKKPDMRSASYADIWASRMWTDLGGAKSSSAGGADDS
jgi:hypothetical protein